MSRRLTEQVVEAMAVYRLDGRGLPTCRGIEIDDGSERANASDVFLTTRVKSAVGKLNPHLPAATIDAVVASISRPPHPTLILNNRWFRGLLTDGVSVEYKDAKTGELRGGRARLIDFDNPANNDFLVVRQLTIQGPSGKTIQPDLILYVNGLPLVVIDAAGQESAKLATLRDYLLPRLLSGRVRVGESGHDRVTDGRQEVTISSDLRSIE